MLDYFPTSKAAAQHTHIHNNSNMQSRDNADRSVRVTNMAVSLLYTPVSAQCPDARAFHIK